MSYTLKAARAYPAVSKRKFHFGSNARRWALAFDCDELGGALGRLAVVEKQLPDRLELLRDLADLRRVTFDKASLSMVIKVCLAGATGWTGSELARSIANADDLTIVAAVSRKHSGRDLGDVLREPRLRCPVYSSATEALAHSCDVLVEYTKPDSAKANVLAALERGAHVVIGTSGLTETDYAELDLVARRQQRGVLACGNFALTVVLMQKFAEAAARLIPQWEIIDYAHDDKIDAPSGTARELAARLSKVRHPEPTVPVDRFVGPREARGATLSGMQVHSVRLPGYAISAEVIFGMPDQKLTIRHDAGNSARLYVDGALLAIRKVSTLVGVHRGLDTVLDL